MKYKIEEKHNKHPLLPNRSPISPKTGIKTAPMKKGTA
jgi:hypothetical protein